MLTARADVLKKVGAVSREEVDGMGLGLCISGGNQLREPNL